MVRAILEHRKWQTRRVDKTVCEIAATHEHIRIKRLGPARFGIYRDAMHSPGAREAFIVDCPYGEPGTRLWVRETWQYAWNLSHGHGIRFRADGNFRCFNGCCNNLRKGKVSGGPLQPGYDWIVQHYGNDHRIEPWRPSIFMPRWASRILLEIAAVRVERVQDISEADAKAEGVGTLVAFTEPCRAGYKCLWDSINAERDGGIYAWAKNPHVWVLEFRKL